MSAAHFSQFSRRTEEVGRLCACSSQARDRKSSFCSSVIVLSSGHEAALSLVARERIIERSAMMDANMIPMVVAGTGRRRIRIRSEAGGRN